MWGGESGENFNILREGKKMESRSKVMKETFCLSRRDILCDLVPTHSEMQTLGTGDCRRECSKVTKGKTNILH